MQSIAVAGPWRLDDRFTDCTYGNYSIDLKRDDGSPIDYIDGVLGSGMPNDGEGSQSEYQYGNVVLTVQAQCSWRLKIFQTAQPPAALPALDACVVSGGDFAERAQHDPQDAVRAARHSQDETNPASSYAADAWEALVGKGGPYEPNAFLNECSRLVEAQILECVTTAIPFLTQVRRDNQAGRAAVKELPMVAWRTGAVDALERLVSSGGPYQPVPLRIQCQRAINKMSQPQVNQ